MDYEKVLIDAIGEIDEIRLVERLELADLDEVVKVNSLPAVYVGRGNRKSSVESVHSSPLL